MIPPTFRACSPRLERGADLVCGYRAQRKDTLVKRLTSRIANFVRSRFTRDGVRDTGCTLKAMRRECVRALWSHSRACTGSFPRWSKAPGIAWSRFRSIIARANSARANTVLGNRAVRATDRHVWSPLAALAAAAIMRLRELKRTIPRLALSTHLNLPTGLPFNQLTFKPLNRFLNRLVIARADAKLSLHSGNSHVSGQPSHLPSKSFPR